MKNPNHFKQIVLGSSLFAAGLLSACGGGGGGAAAGSPLANIGDKVIGGVIAVITGSTEPTTSTQTTLPAQNASSIVNTVTRYSGGAEETAAFNRLNNERSQCGFGRLAQSTQIDAAARAHADYQLRNNLDSHFEDKQKYPQGFTGVDEKARITAQGYLDFGAGADEYVISTSAGGKTGLGERAVRSLLSAPYHLRELMGSYRDVGFSVRSGSDVGITGGRDTFVQINAAYKATAGPQVPTSSEVLTYPCEGVTGASKALYNEQPNPVPGRDLRANPLGTSILVAIRDGQRLTITNATVTKTVTGRAVALRPPMTTANDPNAPCAAGCLKSHQAFILPDVPLDANSVYAVTIAGTNNGVSFNKSFKFTTGN